MADVTLPGVERLGEPFLETGRPAAGPGGRTALPPSPRTSRNGEYARLDLGRLARVALMLTPVIRGSFREQARDVVRQLKETLRRQPGPMTVTSQTVFLRDALDQAECERVMAEHYGAEAPVTFYVLQPPCGGASLALEAWAIGGEAVRVQRFGPHTLAVGYDGVRWVYCGGMSASSSTSGAYEQGMEVLEGMRAALGEAGAGFEHVVRTWFYLGDITGTEGDRQRYQELNRARTDFYGGIRFGCSLLRSEIPHGIYPASTGIGMTNRGLVAGCMTVQTDRKDAFLLALENPQQTPAYAYHPRFSAQSPKFSRGIALVLGDYTTTWVSGTASIVNSESRHPGDIEGQTEQTIDNIQRLIAPENFAGHGVNGAGASLHDLAKVRVYLKRAEDYAKCRAVCERRFGPVPAVYAVADVCRAELLVEIEGVAFSPCAASPAAQEFNGKPRPLGSAE